MRSTRPYGGQDKQALVLEIFRLSPGLETPPNNRSEGQTMANLARRGLLARRRVGKVWYYRMGRDELPLEHLPS